MPHLARQGRPAASTVLVVRKRPWVLAHHEFQEAFAAIGQDETGGFYAGPRPFQALFDGPGPVRPK